MRGERVAGLFIVFSASLCLMSSAQDAGSAAGKAKGESPARRVVSISVPLIVERRSPVELQATITMNREDLLLQAAPLLRELEPLLRPELLKQLQAAADAQANLRLAALKELGLVAAFDEEKLELHVAVPAQLRRASDIRFSGSDLPAGAESALKPSDFSAYLNLRSGVDFVEQSATGLNEGLQPFRGDLEGAINLHNWVIEGSASYTEAAAAPWRRNEARLVYDDPPRRIRYSLGDLSYPVAGFQSYQPLLGLTVARNFSLQPYRITQPLGQTSFFLKAPSKVDVLVNGVPVQTLQLPAGPQNLRDFRFANGANDVTLRITDDVGRIETLQLSFFFDYGLLARGEQEFAYSIGVPSILAESGREYEARFPGFSTFHRIGLTDRLTAGLNLQGDGDQQMFGANAVWATRLGTFQPDAALSRVDGVGFGYGARLGYRYSDPASGALGVFALAAQYRSDHFASLSMMDPHNSVAWDFSANYSHKLFWQMYGGIGANYQFSRGEERDTSGANLTLGKRFGQRTSLDVTLSRNKLSAGQTELRAFLSLTLSFPRQRQTARFSQDTFTETTRADWQYSALNPIGGLDANLGAQRRPDDYNVYGGLRYVNYRADAALTHDVTTPGTAGDGLDSRTSMRLGTALVFADGHFAVSRPVQDSFAIVVPHTELAGQKIGVDPLRESYAARVDWLGPAVVPNLSAYQVRKLTIDAPDLPLGFEVGPSDRTVWPTYKSGTLIRVGTGATVILSGVLETTEGAPVALQGGEIVSLSEPKMTAIEVFTNRTGKFMAEGLMPGAFELRLLTDPPSTLRFEIPKGKAGVYDIGKLKVPVAASPEKPTDDKKGQ